MDVEHLKAISIRIGELADSSDGAALLMNLQKALSHSNRQAHILPDSISSDPPISSASRPKIGVWELYPDQMFRRLAGIPNESDFWSPLVEFEAKKKNGKRLVLLGESAAKGFLYEPVFSPAHALQSLLAAEAKTSDIEVLDLSRTSQQLHELEEMLAKLHLVQPDFVVIFAGNNWTIGPSAIKSESLAKLLREGVGTPEILDLCRSIQAQEAKDFASALAKRRDELGIPFIFVIPEFNTANWSTPSELCLAPLLRGAGVNAAWNKIKKRAEAAFSAKKFMLVRELAEQMIELDGGSSPASFELLARACLHIGRNSEARANFARALDAGIANPEAWAPRCLPTVRASLESTFLSENLPFVSLAEIFKEEATGGLPDRVWFMDYCHLSSRGIARSMAAVAKKLFLMKDADAKNHSLEELERKVKLPSADVESVAHFLAAIHSAHWGQGQDFFRVHCQMSVAAAPIGRELMTLYRKFKLCEANDDCVPAFQMMLQKSQQIKPLFLRPKNSIKMRDYELVETMCAAIGGDPSDIGGANSGAREQLNLARPSHYLRCYSNLEYSLNRKSNHAFFRSYNLDSKFYFRTDELEVRKKSDLSLRLTLRCPNLQRKAAEGKVLFNGVQIGRLDFSRNWTTFVFPLASRLLAKSLNKLEIRWPNSIVSGETLLAAEAMELEREEEADWFPVLGEAHSIWVGKASSWK